jgi:hypothetical protein
MAIQDSGKVTVTLNRTTVEKLRSEKGGIAWDAFMLDLIEGMKQGVRARCVVCRKVVESGDVDLTASMMVKKLGWREISINGGLNIIGFICDKCSSETDKK